MAEQKSTLRGFEGFQEIGRGSYGVVFKARRKTDNQIYVIKQIKGVRAMSKREQQEALQEVQILSSLDHPNIVKYYDSFISTTDFSLNIVMEYATSGNLNERLKKQRGQELSETLIWKYFIQLACALYYVHSNHILHRDIKSLNVFLSGDKVKLGDFGVAKVLNHTMSMAKTMVGTPYYLSPELCENRPYGPKSDVWALGCILYELCTLKHPFDARNQGALILKIIRGKYGSIRQKYSNDLASLVNELLTRNTRLRPSIGQVLSKEIVIRKSAELGIRLPQDLMEPYAPKPSENPQRGVESPGASQPKRVQRTVVRKLNRAGTQPDSRPFKVEKPLPRSVSSVNIVKAVSKPVSRRPTASQIAKGMQSRQRKPVARISQQHTVISPSARGRSAGKGISDAKKREIEAVRDLPSTLLRPAAARDKHEEDEIEQRESQTPRECIPSMSETEPIEVVVSSPSIEILETTISKNLTKQLSLQEKQADNANHTSIQDEAIAEDEEGPINVGVAIHVKDSFPESEQTNSNDDSGEMQEDEEMVTWRVISRPRIPIRSAYENHNDESDEDDGNSFDSSNRQVEDVKGQSPSSRTSFKDTSTSKNNGSQLQSGTTTTVRHEASKLRFLNRLLDRQEKLQTEIEELKQEVKERIGERKAVELLDYYGKLDDEAIDLNGIQRFVFGRISHLDADIPQTIIKVLYLEEQLRECQEEIVHATGQQQQQSE